MKKHRVRVNAAPKIILTALLLAIVTIIFGSDGNKGGFFFNLLVLLLMVGISIYGIRHALQKMENTARDLRSQTARIRKAREKRLSGVMRGDEDYGTRVNWLWEDICGMDFIFSDDTLSEKWNHYVQAGIGSEMLLESDEAMLSRYNAELANMIPGFLTGLGILGTFIGLVFSMGTFSIAAIEESIGSIIGGMNVAFFTSIYGVIFSILFNYMNWSAQQNLSDRVNELSDLLRGLFIGAAGDSAMEKLIHVEEGIGRDLSVVKESLSGNIGQEVGKQISKQLKPVLKDVNATLEQVVTRFQVEQHDALEKITREFLSGVTNGLDSHINRLGTSVDRLSASQNSMTTEMGKFLGELDTSLENVNTVNYNSDLLLKKFERYLGTIENVVGANQRTINEVGQYSRAIADAARTQSESMQAVQSNSALMTELGEATRTATERMNEVINAYSTSFDALSENYRNTIEMIRKQTDAQKTGDEKYQSLLDLLEAQHEELIQYRLVIRLVQEQSDIMQRHIADGSRMVPQQTETEEIRKKSDLPEDQMERLIKAVEKNNRLLESRSLKGRYRSFTAWLAGLKKRPEQDDKGGSTFEE